MYMEGKFGAWQDDDDPAGGTVTFRLFYPDNNKDPSQYSRGGSPKVQSVKVVGDFQKLLGFPAWDDATARPMAPRDHPRGVVYEFTTPVVLPKGFYEYKYLVTFDDGTVRRVSDPCARYGGSRLQSSGIAVGGADAVVQPLATPRRHLRDLVLYELMIDDFTDEYRGARAPISAVEDKLDYLASKLGVNAILFMPWTAWPGQGFNWGYNPTQYFSVEYRYANGLAADGTPQPEEKLSRLAALISACHERGLHVIMDGVFNHVGDTWQDEHHNAFGFPYKSLYRDAADCPYVGKFGGSFGGLEDLDFHNGCTQQFVRDVCLYWIDAFKIDGIRFDNTTNFFIENEPRGLPKLLSDIRDHCAAKGIDNFSLTLEHLVGDDGAASVTNRKGATSCWYNGLYQSTFDHLWSGSIDSRLMRALDTHRGFDPGKLATTYLGNHDHAHVAWQAGARANRGALDWYRTQPWAIALLTSPGAPMIQNGQEFAEDYWVMENDEGSGRRVKPRPIRWDFEWDSIGRRLLDVYRRLIGLRQKYAGLRSDNFYPQQEAWETRFNPQGYGADTSRGLVIYHRWGAGDDGQLERFVVVLNFSSADQYVDVPFPADGVWTDVLNDDAQIDVRGFRVRGFKVNSNWGNVLLLRT